MKKKSGEEEKNGGKYGDGVAWHRGAMLGKGSFGSVYLATLRKPKSKYRCLPTLMAVKSAEVSISGSIQKEREVLSNVKGCPYIIRCFGEETTIGEKGMMVYNILLEYGSGGTLVDRIKKSGDKGLSEFEVRCYTKCILTGLKFIHELGYVHCDLKPGNILLVPYGDGSSSTEFRAKIADFGLAKRENLCKKRKLEPHWRGTPMYLSPEVVTQNIQNQPSDIWALGCIVLEMLTGKPPWDQNQESNTDNILKKIGEEMGLPKIPSELPEDAKDFLKGCFVRSPMYRLTAEMLLNHAFVEGLVLKDIEYEEVEEVEDINGIESVLLVSEDDWICSSENDCFSYCSEEDEFEFDCEGEFDSEDELLKDEECRGVARPENGDVTVEKSTVVVPSTIPSKKLETYKVNITIPVGL